MTLDEICQMTNRPSALNVFHACRKGHPWNATAKTPWANALFVAQQSRDFNGAAIHWLEKQAKKEAAGEI